MTKAHISLCAEQLCIMRAFYLLVVLFLVFHGICCAEFKQQGAKLVYSNPKYVSNVTIFTYRERRHSPYLTTINATTHVPFGDNVTFHFEMINQKLRDFPLRFDFKLCEGFKVKWIKDFIQAYSNIPMVCPVQAGFYYLKKMELPPKNLPLPINNNDYSGAFYIFVTGTKEKIIETSIELKYSG